ncbi:50S ribosomal protein L32 [Patescibacteria group bacterium]|nr:50S ribosomal protein L32 [Patescibacteria group bacterium]
MPEPKKRKTHHKTRIRRSKKIKKADRLIKCLKCDTLVKPHHVCRVCGTYKGTKYLDIEKRERKKKEREKEDKSEGENK